jgi:hypothetical protein
MKTSMYSLLIPAFAALAGSCSNDEALQPEAKQPVVVRATTEYTEVPATRTIFGEPTSADGGKSYSIPLTWNVDETTEHIDVMGFLTDGTAYDQDFTIFDGVADSRSPEDGKSMSFSGTYPYTMNGKFAYFYPSAAFTSGTTYSIRSVADLITTQTQVGNDNLDHLSKANLMYSEMCGEGEAFALKSATAILRFDLTLPEEGTGAMITLNSTKSSFVNRVHIGYTSGTASVREVGVTNSQVITITGIPTPTKHLIVYMMTGAITDGYAGLGGATLSMEVNVTTATSNALYQTKEGAPGTTTSGARFLPGKCYNFVIGEDEWQIGGAPPPLG